jgi:hypothetical protein
VTWTVLFADKTTQVFLTNFNDRTDATRQALFEAARRGSRVIALIKGNCKNNTYFI